MSLKLGALLLAATAVPTLAGWKQVPVVRLEAHAEISAPPAAVWKHMTTGKNLVTWCPVWKSPSNAKINISKVGDVLDFTDQWGGGGRSIVTYLDLDKEIRVAHEPTDGSYLCQSRLVLAPAGSGTRVAYMEQYTDESSAEDLKATAAKVEEEMKETLAALKKLVEKE
jgi:hypothetical protein